MLRADNLGEAACYTNVRHRKWVALMILGSAYRIFVATSRIRKVDALARIEFDKPPGSLEAASRLSWAFDPEVLDAVRMATCFENLFKARLLLAGCVIHRIKKKALPPTWDYLAKCQGTQPVLVSDIKKAEKLTGRRGNEYVFRSLLPETVRWHTLVTESAYRRRINLPDRLFDLLKDVAQKRNTLHFLVPGGDAYGRKVVNDLLYIRRCFNMYVVRPRNRLVKALGFPDAHFCKELLPRRPSSKLRRLSTGPVQKL